MTRSGEGLRTTGYIVYELRGPRVASPAEPYVAQMESLNEHFAREKIALAWEALDVDPGCIEALTFIAFRARLFTDCIRQLQTAVGVGDTLWRDVADKYGDDMDWWSFEGARPYLKAIRTLGDAHRMAGNAQAARWCYERLLRMDPEDRMRAMDSIEMIGDGSPSPTVAAGMW